MDYEKEIKKPIIRICYSNFKEWLKGIEALKSTFKEMEVNMIRARMNEENRVSMAMFLNGLNYDIRDVVELQEYVCARLSK